MRELTPQICCALAVAMGSSLAGADEAGTADAVEPSIWSRPALLDYPGGPKESLRDHGINLDLSLTQFVQGPVSGDGRNTAQYGGKADIVAGFNLSQILSIWDGASLTIHQELEFGHDANTQGDGSGLPVNTALGFPRLGGSDEDTSIVFSQQLGDRGVLSLGKFNMLDAAARRPLEGGGGIDTFQNLAFAAPASGITPPYILGTSLSLRTEPIAFSVLVYDPRNAQNLDVIRNPFEDGVTVSVTGTLPTSLFGLRGAHSIRGAYSTQEGLDLANIPQIGVPDQFQDEIEADFATVQGYWYTSYSFYQYFDEFAGASGKGWGIFGEAAISDGNPNPLRGHWYVGLGGNSFVTGRSDDLWGVAVGQYIFSDAFKSAASTAGLNIRTESVFEIYYNAAVTPWARLSANLQVVNPALVGTDSATFLGVRGQLKF